VYRVQSAQSGGLAKQGPLVPRELQYNRVTGQSQWLLAGKPQNNAIYKTFAKIAKKALLLAQI
jgi:hypothetical protein